MAHKNLNSRRRCRNVSAFSFDPIQQQGSMERKTAYDCENEMGSRRSASFGTLRRKRSMLTQDRIG